MSDSELPNVNFATIERMQVAAKNPNSGPVFMLNLNKYSFAAGFPDGALYKEYMQSISRLVSEVEGKILWRTPVNGQVVGSQDIDEVLGVWYPSHEAFLNIRNSPSSARNMELRDRAVKSANLHWCDPYTVMRNPSAISFCLAQSKHPPNQKTLDSAPSEYCQPQTSAQDRK